MGGRQAGRLNEIRGQPSAGQDSEILAKDHPKVASDRRGSRRRIPREDATLAEENIRLPKRHRRQRCGNYRRGRENRKYFGQDRRGQRDRRTGSVVGSNRFRLSHSEFGQNREQSVQFTVESGNDGKSCAQFGKKREQQSITVSGQRERSTSRLQASGQVRTVSQRAAGRAVHIQKVYHRRSVQTEERQERRPTSQRQASRQRHPARSAGEECQHTEHATG